MVSLRSWIEIGAYDLFPRAVPLSLVSCGVSLHSTVTEALYTFLQDLKREGGWSDLHTRTTRTSVPVVVDAAYKFQYIH